MATRQAQSTRVAAAPKAVRRRRVAPELQPVAALNLHPFTEEEEADLLLHLKGSPLKMQQKLAVLKAVVRQRAMAETHTGQAGKTQRKHLERVAADAKRLLAGLGALSEETQAVFTARAREFALGLDGHRVDPEFEDAFQQARRNAFPLAWHWVKATEQIARYAADQIALTRQDKPRQFQARSLVRELAREIHKQTGILPPGRDSWFADFAARVGDHLGLRVGPRVLATGLKEASALMG